MISEDQERWDERYSAVQSPDWRPSPVVISLEKYFPKSGRVLDVAGGYGQNSFWLAARGLDVTLADVSLVALRMAQDRAAALGTKLNVLHADLCRNPIPAGPWDLIVSHLFLHRPTFSQFRQQLSAEGVVVVVQPTRLNLQRHKKPPFRYLLEQGELPTLFDAGWTILHYREGWDSDNRHQAVLAAKRD